MSNAAEQDVFDRLAQHLSDVAWGWFDTMPPNGLLQRILRDQFSEEEARVLLDVPVKAIPLDFVTLDEIAARSSLTLDRLEAVLDEIAARNLIFSKKTDDGQKAYAWIKGGYGYSQMFFWKGEHDEQAKKMVEYTYDREYVKAQLGYHVNSNIKNYRYIPATAAIDPQWQNVYPSETIEKVVSKARRIALVNCPCRVRYEIKNSKSCGHSLDVCIKFNELADLVIEAGVAKEITVEEGIEAVRKAAREGMVHFADNTGEEIKHICNCCGDACWNILPIRRRQVPRDALMATYFLRETNEDECIACENCVDICPVAAVKIEDGVAKVDLDWCIGCGVCVPRCSTNAIKLVEKETKPLQSVDFVDLHSQIHVERVARKQPATTGGAD